MAHWPGFHDRYFNFVRELENLQDALPVDDMPSDEEDAWWDEIAKDVASIRAKCNAAESHMTLQEANEPPNG